jgi:hypothetical protein
MTWYPKYRCEWKDYLKLSKRVDIEDTTNVGITTLIADGDPLTIENLTTEDEIHGDPIKGSKLSLRVKCTVDFSLDTLYAIQDQQYRVSYYVNSVLKWQGFIFTDQYSEPYDMTPYSMVVTASDQLGILKNILFDDGAIVPTYYNGRMLESHIILLILAKIGLVQFTEYCNIYEVGMNNDVDDSPFDQIAIDADVFQDMDCYSVLGEILRKYNAIVRNIAGKMIIYRPVELSQATVYGRVFTGDTVKTGTSITPQKLINRSGSASELHDINGGTKGYKFPAKKVSTDLDCGNKKSWLDNWELQNSTFTGDILAGWAVKNWTEFGGAYPIPINKGMPGESTGMLLNGHNAYPTITAYMAQSFGVNTLVSSEIYIIEFDYLLYNSSLVDRAGQEIYVYLKSDNASKYLKVKDDEYCEWSNTIDKITITDTAVQNTAGWVHFIRKIVGIPAAGSYTIKLCAVSNTYLDVFVAYKNIQFYTLSTTATVVRVPLYKVTYGWWQTRRTTDPNAGGTRAGTRDILKYVANPEITVLHYEKTNAISGKDVPFGYILGDVRNSDVDIDNILEQFAGSLALATAATETLAQAAIRFIADHGTAFTDVTGSSSGIYLYYTANVPGTDFVSSVTFTNTSGTLNKVGSVTTIQANSTGTARITSIAISGVSGSMDIIVNDIFVHMVYYGASIADTIDHFITVEAVHYTNLSLSRSGVDLLFEATGVLIGIPFDSFTESESGLSGIISIVQDSVPAIARIDQIELTGTSGTANVTYNATTVVMDFATGFTLTPTSAWNTRGGAENKPLLHLICEEIANQMSRPRQMIANWPIREGSPADNTIQLDVLGRFEDALNEDSNTNAPRMFVYNRGSFNDKMRKHDADFIEII